MDGNQPAAAHPAAQQTRKRSAADLDAASEAAPSTAATAPAQHVDPAELPLDSDDSAAMVVESDASADLEVSGAPRDPEAVLGDMFQALLAKLSTPHTRCATPRALPPVLLMRVRHGGNGPWPVCSCGWRVLRSLSSWNWLGCGTCRLSWSAAVWKADKKHAEIVVKRSPYLDRMGRTVQHGHVHSNIMLRCTQSALQLIDMIGELVTCNDC